MYPKTFFEEIFLPSKIDENQKETVFVCMPFDDKPGRWDDMQKACEELGLECTRVDTSKDSNIILTKILCGIAHSSILIFDLSADTRYNCTKKENGEQKDKNIVNHNVIYELGIAQVVRSPEKIIIIRDKDDCLDWPSNLLGMNYKVCDKPPEGFKIWLKELIINAKESKEFYSKELIESTGKLIDYESLILLEHYGRYPQNCSDINPGFFRPEQKYALARMLDLGLLKLETSKKDGELKHSYWFTRFGRKVIEKLGIVEMTQEECGKDQKCAIKQTEVHEYTLKQNKNR